MANDEGIVCGGFVFYNNFDSANLARVEQVQTSDSSDKEACDTERKSCKSSCSEDAIDYEFNLWTKHDCHGTEYENSNRTWFYFGLKPCTPGVTVKLNVVNLNKQVRMFSQGMCPVFKIIPGHIHWERIREKPTYTVDQKGSDFTLSFVYTTPENSKAITYIAFTYPFSYTDLQNFLRRVETRISKRTVACQDDVYYHRECAIKSLEGRRLDVLTISSFHNISTEREDRLKNMFPEKDEERPFKFWNKKIIFVSARVHPGETPSSFVLNGFLNFLVNRDDQLAITLRRQYVFKLIPMLNPDGVARGHYRMDTRGVNLNRVYLNPSEKYHPTIYAARNLIRYYHYSYQLPVEIYDEIQSITKHENKVDIINATDNIANAVRDTTTRLLQQVTLMTLDEKCKGQQDIFQECTLMKRNLEGITNGGGEGQYNDTDAADSSIDPNDTDISICPSAGVSPIFKASEESGLYLYIDLHGHASKKGVFMYGNYFENLDDTITCMLLPKLMSINNPNFHFTSCNFTERNMYIIDKRDGMSREGSGRVAVFKLTGLIRSYTLECNYNSGRIVNMVPSRVRETVNKTAAHMFIPPKYTPAVFEAVGAALGPSILDLTNSNPNSRLPNSPYRSLRGVKSYLKLTYVNNMSAPFGKPLHKEDKGSESQNSYNSKGQSPENCDSPTNTQNSIRSETNLIKRSSIVRRTASFYTAPKRIKNSKKPRQVINRKPLKNQCVNNMESNSKYPVFKSEGGTKIATAKGGENHVKNTNVEYRNGSLTGQGKDPKFLTKKQLIISKTKPPLIPEEISIVKHGAKRLKIMSNKARPKTEIGESSGAASETTKPSTKSLFFCNNQSYKGAISKVKKQSPLTEQKNSKSSKLKETSKANIKSESYVCTESIEKPST